ncbi:PTS sugar transporter subunit IIA [Lactiplantibacillus pentosus]|jgi:PTS system galactitol-specific IIA component|uniref:PTS sugar transporter subunit IIA n=1 Tax=Lactiplantibacillus pentosus TaxID=1589 RepID=UPI001CFF5AE3|nr:PTS sugar transporter subunit IIA [Lactiplantibacillus pentosus]MCB5222736.1 PTS sugar transporter subunit IIA [Lactiplantibacillus pentosus]MCS8603166.1 PTS sugar transporter subunit IIA [Lactiplantibacillus pentosus]MCT3289013.1 PTS sugar transporter subunit IIA [Lactiplantibacillus pentosus]
MSVESELTLSKMLFFPKLEYSNSEGVLKYMADALIAQHFVKKEYEPALLKRESEYPTGLPVSSPGIAIPHSDFKLVNKTTIAVATLQKPVLFHNMENTHQTLPVQIIIMMAIGEPHGQVTMLQKIVGVIQDNELRNQVIDAKTNEELYELLAPKLMA